MRNLLPFALSLILAVAGCGLLDISTAADIADRKGTIKQSRGDVYLLMADRPPTSESAEESGPYSLLPVNLSEAYKQDGLRVLFSANIEECEDDFMCITQPVEIVSMRKLN